MRCENKDVPNDEFRLWLCVGEPRDKLHCHTGTQRGARHSQRSGVGTGPEDGGGDGRIPRGRSGDQTQDGGAPRPRAALRLVEGAGPGTSAVMTAGDPVSTPPVPAPGRAVQRAARPLPVAPVPAAPGSAAPVPSAPGPASVERPLPAAPVPAGEGQGQVCGPAGQIGQENW